MRNQKNQVLLLEDIEPLGRSGDIVVVKPGYARNFLIPQKKGVVAQKHLVRLQQKLKEERAKKAAVDKEESEVLAKDLASKTLKTQVKVDAEGHMYGSVGQADIVTLLKDQVGMRIERRNVILSKPIKKMGTFDIELKLKEGVFAKVQLEITPVE